MKRKRKLLSLLLSAAALVSLLPAPRAQAEELPLRIAFIDSGISTKHIDEGQIAPGKNYVFPEADTQDRIGHGTATASLVLGAEEQGVVGVCPEVIAVPLVVVDLYPTGGMKDGGSEALCQAIYDAVDLFDCQIINISLCTAEDSEELRQAAAYAEAQGTVIVAAVGNDGEEGIPYYPAAYGTVIAVGSADGREAAGFSQDGADVLTPGIGLTVATNRNRVAHDTVSGTSYSCALVSGLCARLRLEYPELSPAGVRAALYGLAEDVSESGFDSRSGWGLVSPDMPIPAPYLDVPASAWSREGILYVTGRGIMTGTEVGLFEPSRMVDRAMFVTVLYRLAGAPAVSGGSGFADADAADYYADALTWASGCGLVQGYDNGLFGSKDPVTREQTVTLLWRFTGEPTGEASTLTGFVDAESVSSWAAEAFAWAVGIGVVSGKENGVLDPQGAATRAETAQLVMNYLEIVRAEGDSVSSAIAQ